MILKLISRVDTPTPSVEAGDAPIGGKFFSKIKRAFTCTSKREPEKDPKSSSQDP